MKVPLIVGGAVQPSEDAGDRAPRQDVVEIARHLGGELGGASWPNAAWYRRIRQAERHLKLDLSASAYGLLRSPHHSVVLSASEKIAIPLAILLFAARRTIPHVVIAHKLSSGLKTRLLRVWRLDHTFAHVICLCQAQADYATQQLGLARDRVDVVLDKVDQRFFRPLRTETESYILAVGQEQRDYATLLQAIAGTGIKLVVVASSPWSSNRANITRDDGVTVFSQISYLRLRELYARARLVVVPLFDVDYAAGVNVVLEAMAMAKPIIASRTRGIADYIAHGKTGVFVRAAQADELRDTILSLWEHPAVLARLGANARQAVETRMNMDIYVEQIARIVRAAVPR